MNQDQSEVKRKGRGPSKKGAMVYIGIRIEKETLDFYMQFPNRQAVIRDALKDYIATYNKEKQDEQQLG